MVNEARRRFKLFISKNDESALHPNIRGAVYEIVLIHGGGDEEFDAIMKIYKTAKIADQKLVALTALGYAQQEHLIQKTLQFSISDDVKNQDIFYAFAGYVPSLFFKKIFFLRFRLFIFVFLMRFF